MEHFPKVTRVTFIDEKGVMFESYSVEEVKIDLQDGERTLKVFFKNKKDKKTPALSQQVEELMRKVEHFRKEK